MSLVFRTATAADLAAVLALLADDDIARQRKGYTDEMTEAVRAAFAQIDASVDNELWIAERSGEVVATLQLTFIPGLSRGGMRRALVEAVRVRADLRGQGIGEAMMQRAMQRARERDCGMMQLTSDLRRTAAHRFYSRIGFEGSHLGMKRML